ITGTSMTAHYNASDFTLTAALTPWDRPEEAAPAVPDQPEERPVLVRREEEAPPVAPAPRWPAAPALAPAEAERAADVLLSRAAESSERSVAAAMLRCAKPPRRGYTFRLVSIVPARSTALPAWGGCRADRFVSFLRAKA